jgi:hypothetical protein
VELLCSTGRREEGNLVGKNFDDAGAILLGSLLLLRKDLDSEMRDLDCDCTGRQSRTGRTSKSVDGSSGRTKTSEVVRTPSGVVRGRKEEGSVPREASETRRGGDRESENEKKKNDEREQREASKASP